MKAGGTGDVACRMWSRCWTRTLGYAPQRATRTSRTRRERIAAVDQYAQYAPYAEPATPLPTSERPSRYAEAAAEAARREEQELRKPRGFAPDEASGVYSVPFADDAGQGTPAWLHSTAEHSAAQDTLQESRERVASRWYALKGVFDNESRVGTGGSGRSCANR